MTDGKDHAEHAGRSPLESVPEELRQLRQWVAWGLEAPRAPGAKPTKVPIDPHTGARASTTSPASWGTLEQALARARVNRLAGVGFVFRADGGHFGVDLDGCRDPATGAVADWATTIITQIDSYTEVSPSGTGVHVIARGKLPPGGRRKGSIEMYDCERYFTVTGSCVEGTRPELAERTAEIATLHAEVFGAERARPRNESPDQHEAAPVLGDDDLIERAKAAKNGPKFERLWAGDPAGYDSASEADLALCAMLAFWTGGDAGRIDTIFRRSGLMRSKWDTARGERTYGAWTIARALAGRSEFYGRAPKTSATRPCTDVGNAERLVARYGRDMRYCWPWGKWLWWDGKRWKVGAEAQVRQAAKDTVRQIYAEAAACADHGAAAEFAKWAKASERVERIKAMIDLARSEPGIPIEPENLNRQRWLLPCLNGTLDLESGRLREHRREDLITKLVPIAFDITATCPTWDAFLKRVVPAQALLDFLQRAVGYSLSGDTGEQVLIFLLGGGANGKSTFLVVLQALLGRDYSIQAAPDLLLCIRGEPHPTDVADLYGVRVAVCTEMGVDRKFDEVRVKRLTGGDPIRARRMREDFWEFEPTHHIWIGANHRPTIRGTDEAIWRRLLVVPFSVRIPESERDKELPRKLVAELPGILAWAVRGCQAWRKSGLEAPDAVKTATTEYREDMDVLGDFLAEECEQASHLKVRASDLYGRYLNWCEAADNEPESQKVFGSRLTDAGFERKKVHGAKWYLGLALARRRSRRGDHGGPSGPKVGIDALGERL